MNNNETGTIEAGGQLNTGASRGISVDGSNVNINVAGSITTTGLAQRTISTFMVANVNVVNSGILSTTGDFTFNVTFFESSGSITNSGTISATGNGSRAINIITAPDPFSIINSGTLFGTNHSVFTQNTVTNLSLNSGSHVTGDIWFVGSGDDLLTVQGNTTMNVTEIDMGDDTDQVTFDQTVDDTLSSNFINVENAIKDNTGKLTLTGNAHFTGTTTINAGALEIGNGGTTGSITGDIINNARLIFNRSNAVAFGGDISGTGTFTQAGSGSTTLTGNNTYTGGTTISAGTLQIGNGGNSGSIAGDITNNASLVFNRSDALIYAGDISGTGSLTKLGGDTLTLTGNNTYTGGTTISAGTLQIGNGGTTGGIAGNIVNNGTLVFNRADGLTYSGDISGTGGLEQKGASALTLTGNNTYTGTTIVSAGDLVFDSGNNTIGSITAAGANFRIENGATVSGSTGFVGRLAGGLAAATVTGAGSLWQTTGDIAVSEFNPGPPTGGAGGILRVDNGGQVNAGGELFLDVFGVLEIDSSSQVTAAGGLRAVFGTIRLLDSGTMNIPDIQANIVTIDTNVFNGTYAGAFTAGSSSPIYKTGTGTLTLTGNTVDTDPELSVVAGTVLVNGTFAGNVSAGTGAVLGGAGTLGNVTLNGGTLAPGNSIGTLNVAGNVDFSAGGTYQVEVDDAGNSDLINATGTATLTNGAVLVIPEVGNYNLSTDYTILTAAGGLGGTTFGSAGSTLAFLTPTLSYDANNVYLNLRRNSSNYADVADTPNQIAVGTALDTLAASGTASLDGIFDNLNILTADGANQAYDNLSGVQHTHANLVALQSVNQFKGILFDRISGSNQFQANNGQIMLAHNDSGTMTDAGNQLMDGNIAPQRGWWMRGTGNFGDIDDTRNATGANYKAGGIAAGLDLDLTDNLTAGAAVGYTRTDADVANGGLDVDSYQAALYGRLTFTHDYYLAGMTGVGYHDMEANRQVTVGLLNTSVEAGYDAWTRNVAIEGGRKLTLNPNTSLTPFVGLEYAHINRDSFTEKDGGVADLKVKQDSQDSLRSSIGARIAHSWLTSGGYRVQPTAELAWVHEFMEDEAGIRAGFAAAPAATFSVDGPELDRDRARVALGFNIQLRDTAFLNLGYQGEFASSDDRHDLAATFRMMW